MPESVVTITTPCRIHFGLLSFGWPGRRQYGGVGVMVDKPLRVTLSAAAELSAAGPQAGRAAEFARRWSANILNQAEPGCRIQVETAPDDHIGLGSGTQLALAVAAGLCLLYEQQLPPAEQLAISVGRGGRSAVGTFGFLHGGLISERGRMIDEQFSQLHRRVEVPEEWRIVLIRPTDRRGVHGEDERRAFLQLPPVPTATTEALWEEIDQHMLPALEARDLAGFGESVYRYGLRAGECFARVQGGPFSGAKAKQMVAQIRGLDIAAVGQSSWGPTLFAITDNADRAQWLVDQLSAGSSEPFSWEVCAPDNRGWHSEVAVP